jgi:hypothetical protein
MTQWWWLSFVEPGKRSLGCCLVEGKDIREALRRAWALGINPGGEVMGVPLAQEVMEEHYPESGGWRERLLSPKELYQSGHLAIGEEEDGG